MVPWKKVPSPKICATSIIFKPQPNVNNRPIGETSPRLFIVIPVIQFRKSKRVHRYCSVIYQKDKNVAEMFHILQTSTGQNGGGGQFRWQQTSVHQTPRHPGGPHPPCSLQWVGFVALCPRLQDRKFVIIDIYEFFWEKNNIIII
jgi:hypothetical protein